MSEGKNSPYYKAHAFPTKIPYEAIMRYILHYTEPGDIVFDGFCGTGMTGLAALKCGDNNVKLRNIIKNEIPDAKVGIRRSILCELSTIGSFISYNFNSYLDIKKFKKKSLNILNIVEKEKKKAL